MVDPSDAASLAGTAASLPGLREAAAGCRACGLWERGTQTVFGEGSRRARIMLVGEQPGDREDIEGRPFVGPAGRLLDGALEEAGIDRADAYVTNVVKHFKWEERGKRRIHQAPNARERSACRPWLEAELAMVRPTVLVAMGATAAKSLLGSDFRVSRERGMPLDSDLAESVMATIHPSAVLRVRDAKAREQQRAELVADMCIAAQCLRAQETR